MAPSESTPGEGFSQGEAASASASACVEPASASAHFDMSIPCHAVDLEAHQNWHTCDSSQRHDAQNLHFAAPIRWATTNGECQTDWSHHMAMCKHLERQQRGHSSISGPKSTHHGRSLDNTIGHWIGWMVFTRLCQASGPADHKIAKVRRFNKKKYSDVNAQGLQVMNLCN